MKRDEIIALLERTGALVDTPSVLSDGRRARKTVRVPKAVQFAPFNRQLCYEIVRHFLELDVHVVLALDVPSIPVAVEVGRQLEARTIHLASAEATALEHGFELHHGERVLMVIDRFDAAAQASAATRIVRRLGARLIGVGSIVDLRGGRTIETIKDITAIRLDEILDGESEQTQ